MNSTPIIVLAAALLLAVPADAQSDDVAYCAKLSDLVNRYFSDVADGRDTTDLNLALAVDQCRKGNTAGIPVLERKLRSNGFSLPRR
jgi:hypothetical protein